MKNLRLKNQKTWIQMTLLYIIIILLVTIRRKGCGTKRLPSVSTLLSQSLSVVNTGRPLKMAAELHPRSGKLIGLSNSNRTARRNQPVQEFNHGLVLSKEPLRDRDVFTVRIDKKVNNLRPTAAASLERG